MNSWSDRGQHAMIVNGRKTKEMIIGPITKQPPPQLMLDGATIDRVKTFKFLGVHVSDDLKWSHHIETICSMAASRLQNSSRVAAPRLKIWCASTLQSCDRSWSTPASLALVPHRGSVRRAGVNPEASVAPYVPVN
jgi:hypothetical protein